MPQDDQGKDVYNGRDLSPSIKVLEYIFVELFQNYEGIRLRLASITH